MEAFHSKNEEAKKQLLAALISSGIMGLILLFFILYKIIKPIPYIEFDRGFVIEEIISIESFEKNTSNETKTFPSPKCNSDADCQDGFACSLGVCAVFSKEEVIKDALICKDSCPLEGKCYPFGYRKSGEYCSEKGSFGLQLKGDSTCENNFECSGNVCVSGKCVSSGLMEKILNWFKSFFG